MCLKIVIYFVLCNITFEKEVFGVTGFSMLVTIDRQTRYYVHQSGGGEVGPVYRASFMVQRGNGIGSYRGLFRFVKPLAFRGKGGRKRGVANRFQYNGCS